MTEQVEAVAGEPTRESIEISQWEFVERVPTRDEVVELLETLPPVWGVSTVGFADYVQALPQNKKIKVPDPTRPNVKIDQYLECWSLYMSVAGRLKMLGQAADQNDWTVDFTPEPHTPTSVPGMLVLDNRIVYREYCSIRSGDGRSLGSKPGTAWVPSSGGKQAAGSNPWEKVETSARGRAIAAWGFGVLPGSGVASVEEIQGSYLNREAMQLEQQAANEVTNVPREELVSTARELAEQLRQERDMTEEHLNGGLVRILGAIGVPDEVFLEDGSINWESSKLRPGQVQLLIGRLRDQLRPAAQREGGKFGG